MAFYYVLPPVEEKNYPKSSFGQDLSLSGDTNNNNFNIETTQVGGAVYNITQQTQQFVYNYYTQNYQFDPSELFPTNTINNYYITQADQSRLVAPAVVAPAAGVTIGSGNLLSLYRNSTFSPSFYVDWSGQCYAPRFYDANNPTYYLDPAGVSGASLNIAGDINSTTGNDITFGGAVFTITGTSGSLVLQATQAGANVILNPGSGGDARVGAGGAGKITAATYDPPFHVKGSDYATFLPGINGVKEEYSSVFNLNKYYSDGVDDYYFYEIDFTKLDEGSDLWLFYQVTNFGENMKDLIVLVSAQGLTPATYIKMSEKNRLQIVCKNKTEVSLRLTAPRFDAAEYPTKRLVQDGGGLRPDPK